MAFMRRSDAVVELTVEVCFKIWVDDDMIGNSSEPSLSGIASEYLEAHVNDHPTIQATIKGSPRAQVIDAGSYSEEAVACPVCGTLYFDSDEVNHIDSYEACTGCPIPEDEEWD